MLSIFVCCSVLTMRRDKLERQVADLYEEKGLEKPKQLLKALLKKPSLLSAPGKDSRTEETQVCYIL